MYASIIISSFSIFWKKSFKIGIIIFSFFK